MPQNNSDGVQIELYEVVSATECSFVTTERSLGTDIFGQAQIKNEHTQHDQSSAWFRNLKTGVEEHVCTDTSSTVRPGHIVVLAKWANEIVAQYNATTAHYQSINSVGLNPFSGFVGAFIFAFMNALAAPLALPYVLMLLYRSFSSKQVGNLISSSRVSPWPALLVIERVIAAVQIVVLTKVIYEWFLVGASRSILVSVWQAFLFLFAVALVGVVLAMITRKLFDRKVLKDIKREVGVFKSSQRKAA